MRTGKVRGKVRRGEVRTGEEREGARRGEEREGARRGEERERVKEIKGERDHKGEQGILNLVIKRLMAYDNKHSQTISTSQQNRKGLATYINNTQLYQ